MRGTKEGRKRRRKKKAKKKNEGNEGRKEEEEEEERGEGRNRRRVTLSCTVVLCERMRGECVFLPTNGGGIFFLYRPDLMCVRAV